MPCIHAWLSFCWSLQAAFSPDGVMVAAGSADKSLYIWDTVSGALLATLTGGHECPVNAVCWSAQSGVGVISADKTGHVCFWN